MSNRKPILDAILARQLRADQRSRGIAIRLAATIKRLWPHVLQLIPDRPLGFFDSGALRLTLQSIQQILQRQLKRELLSMATWAGDTAAAALRGAVSRHESISEDFTTPDDPFSGTGSDDPRFQHPAYRYALPSSEPIIEPPSAFELASIVGPAPLRLTKLFDVDRAAGIVWQGIAQGKDRRQIAKDLAVRLNGDMVAARRTARTEGLRVATQVHLQTAMQLKDDLAGFQVHAVPKTEFSRPEHLARSGTIFYFHPEAGQKGIDQMPQPPVEADGSVSYNCRCLVGSSKVRGAILSISRARYEGQGVKIRTRNGARLTVTANHPVATEHGLIPANRLRKGDYVLSDSLRAGQRANDVDDGIPCIQHVFEAALVFGKHITLQRPDPLEFHGDAGSMKGNIDVVFPDCELVNHRHPQRSQFQNDLLFVGGAAGAMSGERLRSPLLYRHAGPLQSFGTGATTDLHPGVHQPCQQPKGFTVPMMNPAARHAVMISKGFQGLPPNVAVNEIGRSRIASGLPRDFTPFTFSVANDPILDESVTNDLRANAQFFTDALARHAGLIELDQVLDIEHYFLASHVYSVDTGLGYYIGSESNVGIVQGNCWLSPVFLAEPIPTRDYYGNRPKLLAGAAAAV